jgi:hypothetical protein
MSWVFGSSFNPVLDASNRGILRIAWNSVILIAVVKVGEIAVVNTNWGPNSILVTARYLQQNINSFLSVDFDISPVLRIAISHPIFI